MFSADGSSIQTSELQHNRIVGFSRIGPTANKSENSTWRYVDAFNHFFSRPHL